VQPLHVRIQLERIHCFDEGDSLGVAEPYLWGVFFKIDGTTAFVDEQFQLQGTVQTFNTLGDHGNLGTTNVDAGDDINIPQQFGYGDILVPIPLRTPIGETRDVSAVTGCVVVLLEQDNTPGGAVATGHGRLRIEVQSAIEEIMTTLNAGNLSPEADEIEEMKEEVASKVEGAIASGTSVWDWLSGLGNMDDKIGSEVFIFSQSDLLDAGPAGIHVSKRWTEHGDWELTGHAWAEWNEWKHLGGSLTSGPGVASWEDKRLDCFVRGADTHMWHRSGDGFHWGGWYDLGGPPSTPILDPGVENLVTASALPFVELASAPAAVSWGPNRIDTFARGTNRHMWHKWWNGSMWSHWEDLGGDLSSGIGVASWSENRLHCFVRGPEDHMWHKWWDGAWSYWEDLGGTLTSSPAAVSWGPHRIDCFVRGADNNMWHKWFDGGWSDWENLGGFLTSAPAVASPASNRLNCFVRGGEGNVWHKWWDGSAWSDWENLGGFITDGPAAIARGSRRIDCFVRGSENSLWQKAWGPEQLATQEENWGGVIDVIEVFRPLG
jgi:hypothetical protein